MNRGMFRKWILIICLVACVVAIVGCGDQSDEETKQLIIDNLPPQLKPVSEFRFLESSDKDTVAFEFKASNGHMYEGTFDGEYVKVSAK